MLKAVLNSLDDLSEEIKAHYTEKDGKFYLDVDKVDGLALENVDGLKTTVETLRANERNIKADLKNALDLVKKMESDYKDIDPKSARDALSKIDEIANWDGDTKIKEAIEANERKANSKLEELVKQHNEKVKSLENDLSDRESQLQDAIVNAKIVDAISKEGGNIDLLVPHVRKFVNMIKDSRGRFVPEVVKDDGTPRIGDAAGTPMTISQLVQEMKTKDTFAAAFPGANNTGTNKSSTEPGKKTKSEADNVKVVKSTDASGMSKNLDDIAAGKVVVDMDADS
jgi:hypothetical protein